MRVLYRVWMLRSISAREILAAQTGKRILLIILILIRAVVLIIIRHFAEDQRM